MKETHPPGCNCVNCVNKRLNIFTDKNNKQHFQKEQKPYKKHHKMHFNVKKTSSIFWASLKRFLVTISLLLITTLILVVVCKFLSNNINLVTFIVYLVVSLLLLIWCLRSVTKHRLSFFRTFLILIIVGIVVFISAVYLDVRSYEDIKASVEKALSTKTEDFKSSVGLEINRIGLKFSQASDTVVEKIQDTVEELVTTSKVYVGGAYLIGAD
jgi:hypothetical protein